MKGSIVLGFAVLVGQAARATEPADIRIEVGKEQISFFAGPELVARYLIAASVAKPYVWPLYAPGGVPITRAWPMQEGQPFETKDHVHQKSLWFCHGDVIPEGLEIKEKPKGVAGVDFWSESKSAGKIVCVEVGKPATDRSHGQIATRNEWRTADGVKILDETRTLHLYDLGDARLLVFDIDLHASVCPITFGDTKEGSFGARINDILRETAKQGGQLENAEGKVNEKAIWGYPSPWCDYSGPIAGKTVGLAILDHPRNPAPASWHSRGYGLMAANAFGRAGSFPGMKGKTDLFKLAKDGHAKFRYGVLVHQGDAKTGKVADHYQRFVKLPGF